jgi:hypothetical protein
MRHGWGWDRARVIGQACLRLASPGLGSSSPAAGLARAGPKQARAMDGAELARAMDVSELARAIDRATLHALPPVLGRPQACVGGLRHG